MVTYTDQILDRDLKSEVDDSKSAMDQPRKSVLNKNMFTISIIIF